MFGHAGTSFILFFVGFSLALAIGCDQDDQAIVQPIAEAKAFELTFDLTFVIESFDNKVVGSATLLKSNDKYFFVAAPLELVADRKCRLVEWRGEYNGQKFERVVHSTFEVLASQRSLNIAILRVTGTTAKQTVEFARTDTGAFRRAFAAYGARTSTPRPIEIFPTKVDGQTYARAAPKEFGATFFKVVGKVDLQTLGTPLLTEKGQLAAVGVGYLVRTTLYCPAASIRKLMDEMNSSIE